MNASETELGAVVGGISSSRGTHAERLLRLVPSLVEGTLRSADLGICASRGVLAVSLRIERRSASARIFQRLAFWVAREGGSSRPIAAMHPVEAERFAAQLSECEALLRDVDPAAWDASVRQVFARAGAPPPGPVPSHPELRLHAGSRNWQGFAFDPAARMLEVPCALAPPAGDVLRLTVDGIPAGLATVVGIRRAASASALAPAGFTLSVPELPPHAAALLEEGCRSAGAARGGRGSVRFPVIARATVAAPDEEIRYESGEEFVRDYATNLSHGGAFVRTARPLRIGDRLGLRLHLPDGSGLALPATVVHRSHDGIGVQFDLTPDVEASLSAVLAGLSGRPRRVLVVDDDALVRGILADAFSRRGFEVISATDGEAGLRAITDELFALDAVVTDVLMPGISGEALVAAVRTAGGEEDLVLVAVSGATDAALTARLALAGADRVVSKSAGADQVVAAVEEALAIRAAPPAMPDPFSHPAAERAAAS